MSKPGDSYRRILFATSAVGGASVVNILLGIIRMKVAALVLGTAGIGFLGLLQSLIGTGSAIGGLGVNQSATRQIAVARAGDGDWPARRILFIATATLATASAIVIWVFRQQISTLLLGQGGSPSAVGWMGVGVGLTIVAGSQTALLAGLGRVADVARVSVVTACLSTTAAIAFLLMMGEHAVVPYLLAVPVASALSGWLYTARLDAPVGTPSQHELGRQWRQLLGLGAAIMVSGVVANVSQLAVRSLLSQRVGLAELGLYQAAAGIAVTYLAFILQAMSADFYPRVSAVSPGSPEVEKLVNEQTEIALLLGGAVILAMMGTAQWLLSLLYTRDFAGGAALLRWMIFGDILRLASWPMGFALLAAGRGRIFVLLELAAFGTFFGTTYVLIPTFGVEAAGIGFFAMYLFYLPLVLLAIRSGSAFRWSSAVVRDLALLLAGGATILVLAASSSLAAAAAGVAMAGLWFAFGFHRLRHLLPRSWSERLGWR